LRHSLRDKREELTRLKQEVLEYSGGPEIPRVDSNPNPGGCQSGGKRRRKKKTRKKRGGNKIGDNCPICCEKMKESETNIDVHMANRRRNTHYFHKECINKWCPKNEITGNFLHPWKDVPCPLCNQKMQYRKIEPVSEDCKETPVLEYRMAPRHSTRNTHPTGRRVPQSTIDQLNLNREWGDVERQSLCPPCTIMGGERKRREEARRKSRRKRRKKRGGCKWPWDCFSRQRENDNDIEEQPLLPQPPIIYNISNSSEDDDAISLPSDTSSPHSSNVFSDEEIENLKKSALYTEISQRKNEGRRKKKTRRKRRKKRRKKRDEGGAPTPLTYFIVKNHFNHIQSFLSDMRARQNQGLFLENDDSGEDRLRNLINNLDHTPPRGLHWGYHFIKYDRHNNIRRGIGGTGYFDSTLLSTIPELQQHIAHHHVPDENIFPSNRGDLFSVHYGNNSPRSVMEISNNEDITAETIGGVIGSDGDSSDSDDGFGRRKRRKKKTRRKRRKKRDNAGCLPWRRRRKKKEKYVETPSIKQIIKELEKSNNPIDEKIADQLKITLKGRGAW